MPPNEDDLRLALAAYEQRNLPLAAGICEDLLDQGHRDSLALTILGMIALHLQEHWRAVELFREVLAINPSDPEMKRNLEQARRLQREQAMRRPDGRRRFLFIKPWGCGFCSDLNMVLGNLLLAELTGRTPIVHWGPGSLFRDPPDENAWPAFFEPVSKSTIHDVVGRGLSFFPPKWSSENLQLEVNKFEGDCSRMGGPLFLGQREDVAVSDFFVGVIDVLPWARPTSAYWGKSVEQVYRMLFKKHLKLNPSIAASIDSFAAQRFAGRHVIAVHARGSDKVVEDSNLEGHNKQMPAIIASLLERQPDASIFLLTDDESLRTDYLQRFGEKVISTDCLRTTTARGLHYSKQESRTRLGIELLNDMYLAARCDQFVGVGSSNVSAMIQHLKDWPEGSIRLLSSSMHHRRNLFLHLWQPPPGFVEEMAKHAARIEASDKPT